RRTKKHRTTSNKTRSPFFMVVASIKGLFAPADGFGSEEDYLRDESAFVMWVRDARSWAEKILRAEPQTCAAMFEAAGNQAIEEVRQLFLRELGAQPN